MKYIIISIATLILINLITSCKKECTAVCEFEGEIRRDTFPLSGWDTTWAKEQGDGFLVYEGDDGSELLFEIMPLDTSYDINQNNIACGECGDSIVLIQLTPTVSYSVIGADNESINFTFEANNFLLDSFKVFKCVIGELNHKFEGETFQQKFLAGCVVPLDTSEYKRFNEDLYQMDYQDKVDTLTCPIDSASLLSQIFPQRKIEQIELAIGAPLMRFRRSGICFEYTGFRPK